MTRSSLFALCLAASANAHASADEMTQPAGEQAQTSTGDDHASDRLESPKVKIAVMELRTPDSITEAMSRALGAVMPQTLQDLGPFKAISWDDIKAMLLLEKRKDILGCEDDTSCLAEIGGALGADFMISASCILAGDTYLIQLQLMNTKQARVENRVSREYQGGPKGLFDEVKTATKMLVREILAKKSGQLTVSVSEESATIKIDGTIVGVSPLPALTVSGGVHNLEVEKEGFVRSSRDFEVLEQQGTILEIALLPSEEFKKKYETSANRVRTISWITMAVGAAGVVGSGVLFGVRAANASDLRDDIRAYNRDGGASSEEAKLNKRRDNIGWLDSLTLISAGVGLASAGLGLFLYLTGDDPNRYQVETSVGLEVQSARATSTPSLVWTPNGFALSGTF